MWAIRQTDACRLPPTARSGGIHHELITEATLFKQKTAYEIASCLVGSEMCIRDSLRAALALQRLNAG